MSIAADQPLARAPASEPAAGPSSGDRAVAAWLLACCLMVLLMIVIGGITRLTESGLSIMEWAPLTGALPPMSQAEWQRVFDLYRAIPQYETLNAGMTLAEFKTIFWWEWLHRLWGRLIGVAFAVPFLWFLARGRIRRGLAPHLVALFALGGLQGAIGWFMVASGFVEPISVSQYRLVLHLGLALAIYGYMFWLALSLLRPRPVAADPRVAATLRRRLVHLLILAGVTMLFGGFVAGLDAGYIYNSFPLMNGKLLPDEFLTAEPAWLDPFETPATAQLVHRILAIGLVVATLWVWAAARSLAAPPSVRLALHLAALATLLQATLGLSTLLLVMPIPLAAAHQAGAAVLLAALLHALHTVRRPAPARP